MRKKRKVVIFVIRRACGIIIKKVMSKFNVGQRVCLFNSLSLEIESDFVYAVLFAPVAVADKEQHQSEELSKRIAAGELEVREQYQLARHQGVLDGDCLFASEEECRAFYRKFFSGKK